MPARMPAGRAPGPLLAAGVGGIVLAVALLLNWVPAPAALATWTAVAFASIGLACLVRRSRCVAATPLPAPATAAAGLAMTVGVILYGALARAPLDANLVVLAVLGMVLQVAAPFLDRPAWPAAATTATQPREAPGATWRARAAATLTSRR